VSARARPVLSPEVEAYLDALVAAAPPLTEAQSDTIRAAFLHVPASTPLRPSRGCSAANAI
jgi:hypothetical protein